LHPLHNNPGIEPLTPAGILPNSGTPFAAPNAPSIRLQSRERSRPAVPIRLLPLHHNPAIEPLTPAVVLTNAGTPFAAPNAQSIRLQSRERSGAPAPRERAVPARLHLPRAKRAAPGTDTSVPPHCRPIPATHRSRGRRCLSPAPEATARAERPEPSPATCSFATLHRLPDAHRLRSLPETRCFPALAQKLCLLPQFRFGYSRCTTTPRLNRSLRPEFSRIPAPRSRLRIPIQRIQSRERSGAPALRERAVPRRIHPPRERAAQPQHCGRTGNCKRSETNRSLRPSFCRTPAPRSRLRTRNQSAFRAARASGPTARIHPPRAKPAAPGTDTSVPPHCRPIPATHRSRGRRCLSPAPEATARAERPEPSPATCSFATLHRLPDAHHLRRLPETRCSPALAQEALLVPAVPIRFRGCTTTPRCNRSLRPSILSNSGTPFAAPNAQSIRLQRREQRAAPPRIHPPRERAAPPQHWLPCQSREFEILGARPLTLAVVLANAGPVRGSEPIPRAFNGARAGCCCRDPRFRPGG
jgi:hypothetical protein